MALLKLKDLILFDKKKIQNLNSYITHNGDPHATTVSAWTQKKQIYNTAGDGDFSLNALWTELDLSTVSTEEYGSPTFHGSAFHDVWIAPPMKVECDSGEIKNTSNFDFILWKKLESISGGAVPSQVSGLGMFAIFYNVAEAIKNGSASENVLRDVIGSSIYNQFIQVDFDRYIKGQDQSQSYLALETTLYTGAVEAVVSYLDFWAFTNRYPHVFAIDQTRTKVISDLEGGETTIIVPTAETSPIVNAVIERVNLAQPAAPDPGPPNQVGSHFVKKFTNSDTVALLREDYIKSDATDEITDDTKTDSTFNAAQTLFSGAPKTELESYTQVVILRYTGQGAHWAYVHVLNDDAEKINEGYIDTRVLIEFNPYSLEEYCNRFKGAPRVTVPEPEPSVTVPDWRKKTKCEPFLNRQKNEYWVTLEYNTDEEWGDLCGDDGIEALCDYYGLVNLPNYRNMLAAELDEYVKDPELGAWNGGTFYSDPAREDELVKALVRVPQTNLDADYLKPTEILTHAQWEEIARDAYEDIVVDSDGLGSIVIETNKVEKRIQTLKQDLQVFKRRINEYDGDVKGIDASAISQVTKRLDTFVTQITKFLTLNDREFRKGKDDKIIIACTRDYKHYLYATIEQEPEAGGDRKVEPLLRGVRCLKEVVDVFADRRTTSYYITADKINQTKDAPANSNLHGINWVVAYTLYGRPTLHASKKEEKDTASADPSTVAEEVPEPKPAVKTATTAKKEKKDREKPPAVEETKSKAAVEAKNDSGTDSFFKGLGDFKKDVETAEAVYTKVLFRLNLTDYLMRAAACLANELPSIDAIGAAVMGFLKSMAPEDLVTFLTGVYTHAAIVEQLGQDVADALDEAFSEAIAKECEKVALENDSKSILSANLAPPSDLMINPTPDGVEVDDQTPTGTSEPFAVTPPAGMSETSTSMLEGIHETLYREPHMASAAGDLQCAANLTPENWKSISLEVLKKYDEYGIIDFFPNLLEKVSNDIKEWLVENTDPEQWPEELQAIYIVLLPILPELDMVLELVNRVASGEELQDAVTSQIMDAPAFGLVGQEYSDDPLAPTDEAIEQMLKELVTELLISVVKSLLETLLAECEGLDLASALDQTAEFIPGQSQQVLGPITLLTDKEILAFGEDSADSGIRSNLPGTIDLSDIFPDTSNFEQDLGGIVENLNPNVPITWDVIEQLKLLLDYLSQVLKPTEICSLLSYAATDQTLKIVLKIINAKTQFSIIRLFIQTTDNVAKYFALLGQYVNNTFCETALKDLSLVTMLCEKAISQDFYCKVLKQKGFSEEQCESLLAQEKEALKGQLEKLELILSYPTISDYFQSLVPTDPCAPGSPISALINDPYINAALENCIDLAINLVSQQFDTEMMGIKTIFIKDNIIPYGGEYPRYPEVGRDYQDMWNGQGELVGDDGRGNESAVFFDSDGVPQPENFPRQDKIIKEVVPELYSNVTTDNTSETLKKGIVSLKPSSEGDKFVKTLYSTTNIAMDKIGRNVSSLYYDPASVLNQIEKLFGTPQQLEGDVVDIEKHELAEEYQWVGAQIFSDIFVDAFSGKNGEYSIAHWRVQVKYAELEPLYLIRNVFHEHPELAGMDTDETGGIWIESTNPKLVIAPEHELYDPNSPTANTYYYNDIVDAIAQTEMEVTVYNESLWKIENQLPILLGEYVDMTNHNNELDKIQNSNIFSGQENTTNTLVEMHFPKYSFILEKEAEQHANPITLDYNKFTVWTKGSINDQGISEVSELNFDVNDTLESNEAHQFMKTLTTPAFRNINQPAEGDGLYIGDGTITIPQYAFTKLLSYSLVDFVGVHGTRGKLESNIASMHQYLLLERQQRVFNNVSDSSLFDVNNFSKILFAPKSQWAQDSMLCDNSELDFSALRKSLLNPDDIKALVDEYYKKIACDAYKTGPVAVADPVNEAIKFAMVLLYMRLCISEFIVRGIMFFSRHSAESTILDSDLFLSMVVNRMDEGSDIFAPGFMTDAYDTSYNFLKRRINEKVTVEFLSNEFYYDFSNNVDERRFTNFKQKRFNLADLILLTASPINPVALVKIAEGVGFDVDGDADAFSALEVYTRLESKLKNISLKYLINENIISMAPSISQKVLDENSNQLTTLASNRLHDLPTKLFSLEDIRNHDKKGVAGLTDVKEVEGFYDFQLGDPGGDPPSGVFNFTFQNIGNMWLDVAQEEELANQHGFDSKNINFDPYFFAENQASNAIEQSCFHKLGVQYPYLYDVEVLTDLGMATKNGGLILQRFIKVRMNNSAEAIEKIDNISGGTGGQQQAWVNKFLESINADDLSDANKTGDLYISYKAFDFGLRDISSSFAQFENSGGSRSDVSLSDIFSSIKYGTRLVYVLPHAPVNDFIKNTDDPDSFPSMDNGHPYTSPGSKNFRATSRSSDIEGSIHNLITTSMEKDISNKERIFTNRAYEIREMLPVAHGTFSTAHGGEGHLSTEVAEDIESHAKYLKSIYVIPIPDAHAERELPGLSMINFDDDFLKDHIDLLNLADADPYLVRLGITSENLVHETMNMPLSLLMNRFAMPNKDFLNFALLHVMYFPYRAGFNFDKLFKSCKKIVAKTHGAASIPRDEYADPSSGPGDENYNDRLDQSLSMGLDGELWYEFIKELIPKWIFRHALPQVDPCMKKAFEIQEEHKLNDDKLPLIVAGIRPTPIFPPGMPFFGDLSTPITIAGMAYMTMNLLTGVEGAHQQESTGTTTPDGTTTVPGTGGTAVNTGPENPCDPSTGGSYEVDAQTAADIEEANENE